MLLLLFPVAVDLILTSIQPKLLNERDIKSSDQTDLHEDQVKPAIMTKNMVMNMPVNAHEHLDHLKCKLNLGRTSSRENDNSIILG